VTDLARWDPERAVLQFAASVRTWSRHLLSINRESVTQVPGKRTPPGVRGRELLRASR
jgi:hypothetical protein